VAFFPLIFLRWFFFVFLFSQDAPNPLFLFFPFFFLSFRFLVGCGEGGKDLGLFFGKKKLKKNPQTEKTPFCFRLNFIGGKKKKGGGGPHGGGAGRNKKIFF